MQVLYAMNRDKEMTPKQGMLLYSMTIRHSFELYLFNLLQLVRVAEYSKLDLAVKLAKHRPSEDDKSFSAKLFENELVQSILDNRGFKNLIKLHKTEERVSENNTRILYHEFAKTDLYKSYLDQKQSGPKDHLQILLDLYKCCLSGELFNELMEDGFLSWADDKSLVIGAMKKTIKALPVEGAFYQEFEPTDETVREFGEALLQQVTQSDHQLLEEIEPTLKNWDADRVAIIDMILLKMAVCELMGFPTIPTKVTLNEFVEISKQYSTDKSKDFINGILDRLMKKLTKEGKIVKEGRGLLEE